MRRLAVLIAILALAAALAPGAALANGSCPLGVSPIHEGTAADPIPIATAAALHTLAIDSGCYAAGEVFRQTADIDLGNAPWTPIAAAGPSFNGTYDGGGHRITGLLVNDVSAFLQPKGLFEETSGATIRNLVIDGARIEGKVSAYGVLAGALNGGSVSDVTIRNSVIVENDSGEGNYGGLAGSANGTAIERVTIDGLDIRTAPGVATPPSNVGGIVGYVVAAGISDSKVVSGTIGGASAVGGIVGRLSCVARVERTSVGSGVSVTGTGSSVGGAIGDAGPGLCAGSVEFAPGIVDVSSAASVSGASDVGGLIGRDETVDVTRSAATGAVTATTGDAGGLVGRIAGGTVTDSYALGAVTAAGSAGGLIGAVFSDSSHVLTLTRTYAAGHVAAGGGMKSGGLWSGATLDCITDVGISVCAVSPWDPVVTGSFWDTQSTGIPTGPLGTGKSTADMQAIGTFSAAGWTIASGWSADAGRVWGICPIVNGGRPFLVSQYTASACPTAPGAPGSVKVVPGDGRIAVTWTTPASDGGAPITSYTATAAIQPRGAKTALMCSAAPPTTRCVITGLRNGRAYRISVTAANVVGSGSVALAATTATPRRTLTVLSTKADGGAIFTRVRIGQGGVLTQVGRRSGAHAVACRATAVRPTRAGVVTLRCALTGAALDALARAPLSLTIVTRFAPKSGPVASATRRVAIARLKTAEPVVG